MKESLKGAGAQTSSSAAAAALKPSVHAAYVLTKYAKFGRREMHEFVGALQAQVNLLKSGDTSQMEEMLLAQAYSLQALFTDLALRAAAAQDMRSQEALMRTAFKAQSQCRMTLETLGTLRNPPVIFARQANIAQGPQQVNNGTTAEPLAFARAQEITSCQNKLLEATDGERMDGGAQEAPIRANSDVGTVGEVHGPALGCRKGEGRQERVQGGATSRNP
jgi:hypothetical protein